MRAFNCAGPGASDARTACRGDDLEGEIAAAVRIVSEFLARFEFRSLSFSLSTRPSKSVGDASEWAAAAAALARAVESAGLDHEVDAESLFPPGCGTARSRRYLLAIGDREAEAVAVSVRHRGSPKSLPLGLSEWIAALD